MKILQITFTLSSGGAERFVVDLSNELAKTNDVTLLTLKDDTIDAENRNFYKFDLSSRVKYMNLGLGDGAFHPSYPWRIYKVIKKINPEVVHLNGGGPIIKYCYLSCMLLGRYITFIQTIHSDLYRGGYTSRFYRFTYRTLALRGLLRWASLSEVNFQQTIKEYPKAKSRCIYNGRAPMLPTPKFEDTDKEITSCKDNADTKVVLHVARCAPAKNQQLLIQSFNAIRQNNNAILLIIGAHFDSEEGKELQAMAGEGIYFLGTRTNIPDYMLKSDIFVLSSKYEGMPITLIEAILSGMPMVSTPVTGAVDVINGKNGLLSRDFTKQSYIAALTEMLHHYDSFKAEAMKEKDNSPYTIKHCAEQYMEFYNE